jgi:hypothetical protein
MLRARTLALLLTLAALSAPASVLRTAFMAMHEDPLFREEASKTKLTMRPINGAQVREAVQQIHLTPKSVIERARPIMGFP